MRITSLAVAVCLSVVGIVAAQDASAVARRQTNIAAQGLGPALQTLAQERGFQVVYLSDSVDSLQTAGAVGEFTDAEAIEKLLAKSGLVYRYLDAKTISIVDPSAKSLVKSSLRGTDGALNTGPLSLGQNTGAPNTSDTGNTGEAQNTGITAPQDKESPTGTESGSDRNQDSQKLEQVTVTGTHIHGEPAIGSNLMVLTDETIDKSGYATVQDLLQIIPQNFGSVQFEVFNQVPGNFSKGTGINLRGLGTESTLTLINGHRLAVSGDQGDFFDVDSIPTAAIDRIEVLTDGSSAIYGADAIAGVVNIILKEQYDGAETRVRLASANGDSTETLLSQSAGHSWTRGSVLAGYQYYRRTNLLRGERAITASYDKTPFGGTDLRLPFSNPANIINPSTFEAAYSTPRGQDGTNLTVADLSTIPNLTSASAEHQDLFPERTTHSGFVSVRQSLSSSVDLFADAIYSDRSFESKSNPFVTFLLVPDTNPFYVNPFESELPGLVFVAYDFFNELGLITTEGHTKTINATVGAISELSSQWNFTTSLSYGREKMDWATHNYVDQTKLDLALANPDPQLAFNPFGDGSHTPQAVIDSIRSTRADAAADVFGYGQFGSTDSSIATLNAVADGVLNRLPSGDVKLAIGADYRREELSSSLDVGNDLTRNVTAAFTELRLPILGSSADRNRPRLETSVAGRYEHYSDFGSTFNPRFGINFAPLETFQLRGTWGTSFRAPKLVDLDPDAIGRTPVVDVETCALPNGGSEFCLLRGGTSPDLKEETATTWTVGGDLSLDRGESGFTLSITYYNIDFHDRIIAPGEPLTTDTLLQESRWAEIVSRDPAEIAALCSVPIRNGSCAATPPTVVIDGRLRNIAIFKTDGIDLTLVKRFSSSVGEVDIGLNGNYTLTFEQALSPTATASDLLDTRGHPVSQRFRGFADWNRGKFSANAAINYTGSYTDDLSFPSRHIESWATIDLGIRYGFDGDGILGDTHLSLQAVNVFDEDPPFVDVRLGLDPYNANPQGRLVSLTIEKSW